MITGIILDIIAACVMLIFNTIEHDSKFRFWFGLLLGVNAFLAGNGICQEINKHIVKNNPTALDVYRGHTELDIKYAFDGNDFVPTDTIIKFTDEYERIMKMEKYGNQ